MTENKWGHVALWTEKCGDRRKERHKGRERQRERERKEKEGEETVRDSDAQKEVGRQMQREK